MIERAVCTTVFYEAVAACDPAVRVREALAREPVRGREIIGLAVGKAAVAMARGAGNVTGGLLVAREPRPIPLPRPTRPDGEERDSKESSELLHAVGEHWQQVEAGREPPTGWVFVRGGHPVVDESSLEAGAYAINLVERAEPDDVVLALISGGASALIEQPLAGISLDQFRQRVHELMASGAPIHEINRLRTELSAIKGGKLAARSQARVVTLVVSDVIGDDPRVIGSGPTVTDPLRDGDRVEVVAPMSSFGVEIVEALAARGVDARRLVEPLAEDVATVADRLAAEQGVVVAWGEPTVRVPEQHGIGGRAQQLALELAKRLRGTVRSAFVAGSDGVDGPSRRGAAGAYVDGSTWDAIIAAKLDPDDALRRCDAGTVLDAVGALVVTGPTGINHADIVILG